MKSIKFLQSKGVDVNNSLELFGDIQKYNDKLGEFLVGIHSNINQLITFMQNKDMVNYLNYVKSMKTDARFFGFDALATVAEEHEEHSEKGDLFFVTGHINELINETNNAIVLIQEYMNGFDEESIVETTQSDAFQQDTILVVDDSNIIRNFVKRIFSEQFNVGTAKNGEDAIRIIEANKDNGKIKAILLDLNMPKLDGFGVLEFMRKNDYLDQMPVSIISGDSTKETIDRAFTYNIVDMVNKPFNDNSIKQVIEKTMMYYGNND